MKGSFVPFGFQYYWYILEVNYILIGKDISKKHEKGSGFKPVFIAQVLGKLPRLLNLVYFVLKPFKISFNGV